MKKFPHFSQRNILSLLGMLSSLLALFGLYRFRRQILGRSLKIGAPPYPVTVTRGVRIPAAGGAGLIADHYAPAGERLFPTILIRIPAHQVIFRGTDHPSGIILPVV